MWNIEYMREKAKQQNNITFSNTLPPQAPAIVSKAILFRVLQVRNKLQPASSVDLSLGGGQLEAARQLRGRAARHNTLLPRREKLSEALMRVIQYA